MTYFRTIQSTPTAVSHFATVSLWLFLLKLSTYKLKRNGFLIPHHVGVIIIKLESVVQYRESSFTSVNYLPPLERGLQGIGWKKKKRGEKFFPLFLEVRGRFKLFARTCTISNYNTLNRCVHCILFVFMYEICRLSGNCNCVFSTCSDKHNNFLKMKSLQQHLIFFQCLLW